jgi:hypothetical protein
MYSNEQVSEGVSVEVERAEKPGWREIDMKKKKVDKAEEEEEEEVYNQMRIFQSVGGSPLLSFCCSLNPSLTPPSLCSSTTPTPCSSVPVPAPVPVPGRRAPLFNAWYLTDAWYHWLG